MAVKKFRWTSLGIALIISLHTLAGCAPSNLQKTPQTNSCEDSAHIAQLKKSEQLLSQMQNRLSDCRAEAESFNAQIQRSQIELLEKGAQIQRLESRISSQQQTIDEAVLEVVRTKAKLRSIESRAEAASTIAETEIALKDLKKQNFSDANSTSDPFDKVESLLRMSADEFKRENYGGALYLSGKAKAQIKGIQSSRNQEVGAEMSAGEVVFSPPLPLILIKRSNLRKSPDINSDVLRVLEKGMTVIGYSHKDEWIRVRMEDGEPGWIHQSLIQGQ
jgi:predicted RNase H-like nuclease (RuvC/YqgF family)